MDRYPLLFLACIVAGFALLKVPVGGTFLAPLHPLIFILGVLAIMFFSCVLLYQGVMAFLGKGR